MKLALCLFGCALSLYAVQATAPEKPKDQKCSIEGRVLNSVTGEAVRKATVTLAGTGTPIKTETDDNGRFSLQGLDAGRYQLIGEKAGFARQAYGARSNPLSGTSLFLSTGQQVKDLVLRLAPNAVISGRVLDEDGEPVPSAMVMALRPSYQRGERQYSPLGTAQSNDLGEFRIASLSAGSYLVSASSRSFASGLSGVDNRPSTGKPERDYVLTYYPNSADVTGAVRVQVGVGAEARSTDIRLAKANTVHVRGKVSGAPEGAQVLVMLMPKGAGVMGILAGRTALVQQKDGSFDIGGVAPGSYTLSSMNSTLQNMLATSQALQVGEQNVEGVVLQLSAGAELSGAVVVEGLSKIDLKNLQVGLISRDSVSLTPPRNSVGEDGKFTLKNVSPVRYLVQVAGTPPGSYVKSVRYSSQEVPEEGLDLSNGVAGALQITLSPVGAQVDGRIQDAEDKPVTGATVVLIPDSRRYSLYKEITSDQSGGFSFTGVAPGEYKALAWEDIESGAYQDPEFLKQFESKAEAVSLKENDHKSVQLKVIPIEKGK